MIGGSGLGAAVLAMGLGMAGGPGVAAVEAAETTRPAWSVATSAARYVLAHEGPTLRLSLGPRQGPAGVKVWNGRNNCAAHGYAIVTEANGAFFFVRYAAVGADATRYTVRHVSTTGHEDWEWQIEIPVAASTVRQIALVEVPRS